MTERRNIALNQAKALGTNIMVKYLQTEAAVSLKRVSLVILCFNMKEMDDYFALRCLGSSEKPEADGAGDLEARSRRRSLRFPHGGGGRAREVG